MNVVLHSPRYGTAAIHLDNYADEQEFRAFAHSTSLLSTYGGGL